MVSISVLGGKEEEIWGFKGSLRCGVSLGEFNLKRSAEQKQHVCFLCKPPETFRDSRCFLSHPMEGC